jgi:hypothetical protein
MRDTIAKTGILPVRLLSEALDFVVLAASLFGRSPRTIAAFRILSCFAALHFLISQGLAQGGSCLVPTSNGDVQGIDRGASCAFLGIPYAASPTGNNRWKPPKPNASWAPLMFSATMPPPSCSANEDCLKLNIWTPDPAPGGQAPVIVWLQPPPISHPTTARGWLRKPERSLLLPTTDLDHSGFLRTALLPLKIPRILRLATTAFSTNGRPLPGFVTTSPSSAETRTT